MEPVLVLEHVVQRKKQEYFISRPTHLGRLSDRVWKVMERKIPYQFEGLELFLDFSCALGEEYVSRNHAAIIPRDGKFFLVDLQSGNGTYLNERELSGSQEYSLSLEDKIRLGPELSLTVTSLFSGSQHHALLFGHDGGNLKGVLPDLNKIKIELEIRGFAGNVCFLYNCDVSLDRVCQELQAIAYRSTAESHSFFYFSGHGTPFGLHLGSVWNPLAPSLTPKRLYSLLGNIRGKKAVVLDCCHAGIFIDKRRKNLVPFNTLVLAGCSPWGKAYEGLDYRIAGGNHMGYFTRALVSYLRENPERLNLRDFEGMFQEYPFGPDYKKFGFYFQAPQVGGIESFTLMAENKMPFSP